MYCERVCEGLSLICVSQRKRYALVNDIDLLVTINGTSVWLYGNRHLGLASDEVEGDPDAINNVEKVIVAESQLEANRTLIVTLSAASIAVGPQPISLVVSGGVRLESTGEGCVSACSGRGTCGSDGNCHCEQGYEGTNAARHR